MGKRTETVLFDERVAAGQTVRLRRKLPYQGTIRRMTIEFYPGQQKTLQVNPYLLQPPDILNPLTKYVGDKPYFSGDDSKYDTNMAMRFVSQAQIAVDATNVSPTYDYDLYVLFEIEREADAV